MSEALAVAGGELSERDVAHAKIDSLEQAILDNLVLVDMPLVHRFTPGLYVREIFMPKGTLLTSKIHNTEHPYVVLKGSASVYTPDGGVERITAPHVGITKPGTRRVLYIHEDCTWLTFHPLVEGETSESDLPKIEERIIEKREWSVYEQYVEGLKAQAIVASTEGELLQEDYGGAP